MDHTEALPDDALAAILGRLPPRDLAASHRVRKAWRAVVDAHGLLLPHLLPHMVRGIFISRGVDHARRPISFLARPSAQQKPRIRGDLGFLPRYGGGSTQRIVDHCNGLLLYRDFRTLCVVNPATRRWDELRLPWKDDDECDAYLAFDPASSLHYEVFLIPREAEAEKVVVNPPPSVWRLNVFSSSTEQWHERFFVREGEAMEALPNDPVDVDSRSMSCRRRGPRCGCTVYWQGSLYVNFSGLFVVRLSSSHRKYRGIKTPIDSEERKHAQPYLGKLENGVYFATMHEKYQLRLWILVQPSERIDWVLKHNIDLSLPRATLCWSLLHNPVGMGKTWILDGDDNDVDGNKDMLMAENLDWDSDDDNVLTIEDRYRGYSCDNICFLGFHPYREIVFLGIGSYGEEGLAYHLNSSKIQYLGRLHPKDYSSLGMYDLFPYTPCKIGHLLKHGS